MSGGFQEESFATLIVGFDCAWLAFTSPTHEKNLAVGHIDAYNTRIKDYRAATKSTFAM